MRSLLLLVGSLLLPACVSSSLEGEPPSWNPDSVGPADGTSTGDDGLSSASGGTDDGPLPCVAGDEGCPCVMNSVCKAGLICEQTICVPCSDCAECGNASCDVARGESCGSCPSDCGACQSCGNGTCEQELAENCSTCPDDCGACQSCGDGTCDPAQGEDCFSCPDDCETCPASCGDMQCNGDETCANCPGDCECPPPPPVDPCADDSGGWWCGETIGGTPGTLYTCSSGVTTNTQPCAHGCALCALGTPDVCKAFAGQSDADACSPAECTDVDQSACSEYETCAGGTCTACGMGTANCDGTAGCECAGYCAGGVCCTAQNCGIAPQCQIC
ncbi:MAG: hypothetical protein K0V04_01865 [Deltaproteobacteria bacterium]|nr:hypothetical protein [Deltaproteobacteria bacterium]